MTHALPQPYLRLQARRAARRLRAFGLAPWLALPLAALAFALTVAGVYASLPNFPGGPGLLVLAALALASLPLARAPRVDPLRVLYRRGEAARLRLAEHLALALPFALALAVAGDPLLAALALPLAAALSRLRLRASPRLTLWTPFGHAPALATSLAFPAGVRRAYPLYAFLLLLLVQGLRVGNANLVAFAAGVWALVPLGFYAHPEPPYLVWTHAGGAARFLRRKTRHALAYALLLALPVLATAALGASETFVIVAVAHAAALAYLTYAIALHYALYPREAALPRGLAFAAALALPPGLLVLGPIAWRRAVRNLASLLPAPHKHLAT